MTDELERKAWLHTMSFAGSVKTPILVVGETPKRYRVRLVERTKLPGREKWGAAGDVVLVPRSSVSFREQGEAPPAERPVAATVLLRKGELVLGVSRKDNPTDFGLPGGKIEHGESAAAAAARELFEETWLNVESTALREVFRRDDAGGGVVVTFTADAFSGEPEAHEEGVVAWVTWEQLIAGCFGDYNARLKEVVEAS